jgi:aquaporin NIP
MREDRKYAAEFIGTFALAFAGTGAITINDVTGGAVTSVGVGLTFGMIVLWLFAARRLEGKMVVPPMCSASSQARWLRVCFCAGCFRSIRPWEQQPLPGRLFSHSFSRSFSVGAKERGITAGIAVGSVIALEALFAGRISGASMNPARFFAPALVSQHLSHLWIYLLAPVAGALLAVVGCRCVRKDCCSVPGHGMINHPS